MNFSKFFLFCVMLFVSTAFALAQDTTKTDDFNFDDIPVDDQKTPYIGVGGGGIVHLNFINTTELNNVAKSVNLPDFPSQNITMYGGGGFTAIGIVPNLRVGVYSAGGSIHTQADANLNGVAYTKDLSFSTAYTAAQIDYAIGITKSINIFPGLLIGITNDKLLMAQTKKSNAGIVDIIDSNVFSGNSNFNKTNQLTTSRFMLNPQINIEYNAAQFVMIRAGAGYKFSFESDWLDVNKSVVPNISKDINSNGLSLQFGLFIGLFQ